MRVEEIGRVHQWDAERRVRALGAPAGAAVAMANDGDAQGWSVPVEADGTAPIPPELLQSGRDVTCWLTVGGNVVATDRVPVVRRAKPADYAYAPTDAKRVEDLRALLEGLTAQAKGAAERWPALEDAAEAATKAANGAAADVLRRADAGEFDGAQGPQGEQGAPGRDGAKGEPGEPGRTPVRGVDYWTAADRAPIEAATAAANQAAKEVAASRLVGEVSGAVAHADDAFPAPALGLTVYGASVQDGTPTPAAPKPITSVTSAELRISGEDAAVFDALPLDLRGHELRSLPNGVRDELRIDENGGVELVQRVGKATLDGSESWHRYQIPSGGYRFYTGYAAGNQLALASGSAESMSTIGIASPDSTWTGKEGAAMQGAGDGITNRCNVFVRELASASAQDFAAWISAKPIAVLYQLAAPNVIPLGKVVMPTLPAPVANACVASDVPTECAARYARDANIVIGRLEDAVRKLGGAVSMLDAPTVIPEV